MGRQTDTSRDGLWRAERVAEYTGFHIQTVYEKSRLGELKSVKLGPRSLRFRPADVDAWIEAMAARGAA